MKLIDPIHHNMAVEYDHLLDMERAFMFAPPREFPVLVLCDKRGFVQSHHQTGPVQHISGLPAFLWDDKA